LKSFSPIFNFFFGHCGSLGYVSQILI
jgi:hypothetical protein